jgi:hypothetical protein
MAGAAHRAAMASAANVNPSPLRPLRFMIVPPDLCD